MGIGNLECEGQMLITGKRKQKEGKQKIQAER